MGAEASYARNNCKLKHLITIQVPILYGIPDQGKTHFNTKKQNQLLSKVFWSSMFTFRFPAIKKNCISPTILRSHQQNPRDMITQNEIPESEAISNQLLKLKWLKSINWYSNKQLGINRLVLKECERAISNFYNWIQKHTQRKIQLQISVPLKSISRT